MRAVVVMGGWRIAVCARSGLEDLVHISRARIVAWAQRRDCVEQGGLKGGQ